MISYTDESIASSYCDFALSIEVFEEYASISDYMSKRRKEAWLLVLCLLPVLFIFAFCCMASFFPPPMVIFLVLCFLPFPAIIISLISKRPPYWWFKPQANGIVRIYKEALGYRASEEVSECKFAVNSAGLAFATERREIRIPLDEVCWVRQNGDLVVVGCFDGWNSLTNATMGSRENHYEACPAAAFLKSKLKGMDSDELIGFLKECAKKPKPPNPRGYIRDLPDGELRFGNDVYSA